MSSTNTSSLSASSASSASSSSTSRHQETRAILNLIKEGIPARLLLKHFAPSIHVPPEADEDTVIRILIRLLEPAKRKKLKNYNTISDAVELIRKSNNIIVLSGAGISTSAGLPDFRSRDGIYVQINAHHPDLVDPKYMFEIGYFRQNPLPFYHFAKALYPGQFAPTIGHNFIRCIEQNDKLLRNYTQNIDTLEKQANIERVIECHGSFAKATCTFCGYECDGEEIKEKVMNQEIPNCPKCHSSSEFDKSNLAIMKPNIVFFGEELSQTFHESLDRDRTKADLLIVIGSSLKVKPVALIPLALDSSVPQILINREPLDHMKFDIELLGNCDEIIQELCLQLGDGWAQICKNRLELSKEIDIDSLVKQQQEKKVEHEKQENEGKSEDENAIKEEDCNENVEEDDDENWDDVEILLDDDSMDELYSRDRANIEIPSSSYVYLKPNTYLFQGVDITNDQLESLKERHSSVETG